MKLAKLFVWIGRFLSMLAFIALLGAGWTNSNGMWLGMSSQHLFYDSIALSLLSIVCLLDSSLHLKGI